MDSNEKDFYDRYYFLTSCGVDYNNRPKWELFFAEIADRIVSDINPKTVFDAGCAYGYLVAALRDRGVEAYGIDISEYAINQVREDIKPYCKVGSILEPLESNYDLIISIEVMEHLQAEEGRKAIENLCKHTEDFLFTSTPIDFKEATHFNVQPTEYWAKLFAGSAFYRDIDFDASFIITHAVRFRKSKSGAKVVIGAYEKSFYRYSIENKTLRDELVASRAVIAKRFEENESPLLQLKNHQISEKEFQINSLNNIVKEKDNLIVGLTSNLDTKDGQIKEMTLLISEKENFNRQLNEYLKTLDKAHLKKVEEQALQLANSFQNNNIQFSSESHFVKALQDNLEQLKNIVKENARDLKEVTNRFTTISQKSNVLDNVMDEKYKFENHYNELVDINVELKEKLRVFSSIIEEKENLIGDLRKEIHNLEIRYNNELAPYKFSYQELERIQQLKGYKLLWQFYKVRDKILLRNAPNPSTPGNAVPAPIENASKFPIEEGETILEREKQYFSKNPLYNIEFEYSPIISIIVPVYNTPTDVLDEMIKSVRNQTYIHFELCLIDASPDNASITACIKNHSQQDQRIVYRKIENTGIAANTNVGIGLAKGEFIAFLDHDDIIAPNALFEVVTRLQDDQQAWDFFYSDKDTMYQAGKTAFNPLYKPEWSPEIMFSANYLTHFCVVRKRILEEVGLLDSTTDGAQDWDIYLKISRVTEKICHIPNKLYHWRIIPTSVASGIGAKPYALDAQIRSLENHFKALKYDATPSFHNRETSTIRIKWNHVEVNLVTFIINHNASTAQLQKLLTQISVFSTTYLINIAVTILAEKEKQTSFPGFNGSIKWVVIEYGNIYEHINAIADAAHDNDVLVVADSQLFFSDDQGINELVTWAAQEQYGAITPKITDAKNNILTAGIVINGNYILDVFQGVSWTDIVIFGGTEWYRNISAVRVNCFAIKARLLKNNGPILNEYKEYALIEWCLRILRLGYRHVYNPYCVAFAEYLPNLNEVDDQIPFNKLKKEYGIKECDRYWNPNFLGHIGLPTENKRKISIAVPKTGPRYQLAGWETEAFQLAQRFDFSENDLIENQKIFNNNKGELDVETVNWILPHFEFIYYAGIYTIFRFANYMQSVKGVKNTFIIAEGIFDKQTVYNNIVEAFPLLKDAKVVCISNKQEIKKIPYADATICTFWTTAYYLLCFNLTKRKLYFIQDYEPLFYPAGSTYGQTETTYKFGFYGITNTYGLRKIYEEQYKAKAIDLKPCIDEAIFYTNRTQTVNKKIARVFFYGRPGHTRNGFELGSVALKILKSKLNSGVEIYCAGSDWEPSDYGLEGIVTNLGRMDFVKTGDLYRLCDVGLIMMFTKHPSYLPFELMACGCAVVSNYNNDTSWFLKDGENCILTEASATRIAETIENLLADNKLRGKITENAVQNIRQNHAEWNTELDSIYQFMRYPDVLNKPGK